MISTAYYIMNSQCGMKEWDLPVLSFLNKRKNIDIDP